MRGGKVLKLALLAAIGAAIAAAVKSVRGEPAPVFSNHPTVNGGPPKPAAPAAPSAKPTPEPEASPAAAPDPEPVPEPVVPVPSPAPHSVGGEQAWVDPVDGECPDGYPVKVKLRSGIFHAPGTATYDRTKPDRCYPDVASAEADGMRAPKR